MSSNFPLQHKSFSKLNRKLEGKKNNKKILLLVSPELFFEKLALLVHIQKRAPTTPVVTICSWHMVSMNVVIHYCEVGQQGKLFTTRIYIE